MTAKEQEMIDNVRKVLPIIVYAEPIVLPHVRKAFKMPSITKDTELEIHSIQLQGEFAGLVCELRMPTLAVEDQDSRMLSSLTQLRIKKDQPLAWQLEKYRKRRIEKLRREGSTPRTITIDL
ncbi:MAG: hypothetical protein WBA17_07435 [Saprospiraceae bacterium]